MRKSGTLLVGQDEDEQVTPFLCDYSALIPYKTDRLKRKEEGAKKQIKNFFFFLGADDGFATQSKWNSHLDWNIIIIFNFHRSSGRTHKRSCEKLQIVEGWTGGRLDSSNRPVPSLDSITKWERPVLGECNGKIIKIISQENKFRPPVQIGESTSSPTSAQPNQIAFSQFLLMGCPLNVHLCEFPDNLLLFFD